MKLRTLGYMLACLVPHCASVQAANLMQNPDFDSGFTAWTTGQGTSLIDNVDGTPSAPAAQLSTVSAGVGSVLYFTQCVSLAGSPPPWDFGIRVRVVSTTGSSCQIYVYGNFGTTCNFGGNTGTGVGASAGGMVPGMQGTFTQYAGTTSDPMSDGNPSQGALLAVQVYCPISGDSMTLNVDHAYLGTSGTAPVSLQSFDVK